MPCCSIAPSLRKYKIPANFKKPCRNTCSLLTQDWQRETWLILQLCSQVWESYSPRTQAYVFLARGFVISVHKRDAMLQLTQSVGCSRTKSEASAICVADWAAAGLLSVCNEILSASSLHRSQSNNQSVSHHHFSLSPYQIKLLTARSNQQFPKHRYTRYECF